MDYLGQIRQVADLGTTLVTDTTKYLSTLPHPIEVLEELIAVIAVTSNLLTSLHSTFLRFPRLLASLSLKHSFIGLLCEDVKKAFKELEERVTEAKGLRVFEPNDVGLVRLPENAWCLVIKGEHTAASIRSRLYVEKYRVRVLIDAVCWVGLNGKEYLREEEKGELKGLRDMLPLIAERLVGVQMDYVPRLIAPMGGEEKEFVNVEEKMEVVKGFRTPELSLLEMTLRGKRSIRSSASTDSLASTSSSSSSVTITDDSIQEVWLLRRSEAKRALNYQVFYLYQIQNRYHKQRVPSLSIIPVADTQVFYILNLLSTILIPLRLNSELSPRERLLAAADLSLKEFF